MTKKERKQNARAIIARVESSIADRFTRVEGIRARVLNRLGRFEVLIAVDLFEGTEARKVLEKDWLDWAMEQLPGKDEKSVRRWVNAGRVAYVLRGPANEDADGSLSYPSDILGTVPNAYVTSLVPLYRILSKAGKDAEKIAAAEDLVRSTWLEVLASCEDDETEDEDGNPVDVKSAPTAEAVREAAERVAPTNRSGGGGGGSSEDDDDDEEDTSSRRESSETLTTVTAAAVEAAAGPTSSILRKIVTEGTDETTAKGIMLAALRLAGEHGISVVEAVLLGVTPAKDDETTEDDETAAAEAAAS